MHVRDLEEMKKTGFGLGALRHLAAETFGVKDEEVESMEHGYIHGACLGTPASLYASHAFQAPGETAQFILGTLVPAMRTADILYGKLGERLLPRTAHGRPAPVLQRDMVDLALAPQLEPGVLQQALERLSPKGRETVAARLASVGDGWLANAGRPVLDAAHDVQLETLPAVVAEAVARCDETRMPHFKMLDDGWADGGDGGTYGR